MMIPATSTSDATNGDDAIAGSKPSRVKSSGSIAPTIVPVITTNNSVSATTARDVASRSPT